MVDFFNLYVNFVKLRRLKRKVNTVFPNFPNNPHKDSVVTYTNQLCGILMYH